MDLEILPLAVTMMVGPQIMSAILFLTTPRPVPTSLGFLAGVAVAVSAGVAIALVLANLIGDSLGDSGDRGSLGLVIQYGLVALLVARAIQNYLTRATAEPPSWMGTLQSADWKLALKTGLLLIVVMPSDIIIMLTVGVSLAQGGASWVDGLPFIAATVLIAALPLLGFLLFGRRAREAMPKVRDWMNTNSWLVNIIACSIFVILLVG
jgi:hypothetical protein